MVTADVKKAGFDPYITYEFLPGVTGAVSDDPMDMRNKPYV